MNEMNDNDPLLLAAIDAVTTACGVARKVQDELEGIRQITKDDRSPVTVADYAVQAVVAMILRERLGDVRLAGEEHAGVLRGDEQTAVRSAVVDADRTVRPDVTLDDVLDAIDAGDDDGTSDDYWTVDPVDGTKGFLRGQQYAIALARLEQRQVVLGVMGCPNLPVDPTASLTERDPEGSIYTAVRGKGAWRLTPGGREPVAAARRVEGGVRTCESVESGHSKHGDTARILDEIGGAGTPVRLDSQCKYAVVARGQADAYLRLPTRAGYQEKIWDHAAGMIVAEEAGAVVTDITGASLDFSHGRRLAANRGIVCASPAIHDRIIAAIRTLGIGSAAVTG
jgi:3'(2'), 5'-bisphosphate nucleotidase